MKPFLTTEVDTSLIRMMATKVIERHVIAGEYVTRSGDPGDALFIVKEVSPRIRDDGGQSPHPWSLQHQPVFTWHGLGCTFSHERVWWSPPLAKESQSRLLSINSPEIST